MTEKQRTTERTGKLSGFGEETTRGRKDNGRLKGQASRVDSEKRQLGDGKATDDWKGRQILGEFILKLMNHSRRKKTHPCFIYTKRLF